MAGRRWPEDVVEFDPKTRVGSAKVQCALSVHFRGESVPYNYGESKC